MAWGWDGSSTSQDVTLRLPHSSAKIWASRLSSYLPSRWASVANTAIFGLVNGILLQRLPVPRRSKSPP